MEIIQDIWNKNTFVKKKIGNTYAKIKNNCQMNRNLEKLIKYVKKSFYFKETKNIIYLINWIIWLNNKNLREII